MVKIKVDNQEVDVAAGSFLLDGARKLGIEIPTLCHLNGRPPLTSCMVCLVKVKEDGRMLPACGTEAKEGMEVESETPEVHEARRTALELLLGEHGGDCLGPCHTLCPAWMDIPCMIRQIAEGSLEDAIRTVKEDIALPAVLHRICPAPCEKGCRRAAHDGAVSIRLLVRRAADADLASKEPYRPQCRPDRPERAAIVGAGPAGLAAAFHLRKEGFGCTVFDDHEKPGGMLRYGVPRDVLPLDVLEKEISLIEELGVEFRMGIRVGDSVSMKELREDFGAVLVATGSSDKPPFDMDTPGVFAAGNVVRPGKLAVRALAQGKKAARAMAQYLRKEQVTEISRPFTTRLGKLKPGEMEQFLADAGREERIEPAEGMMHGFSDDEARREARRCLECDCAGLEDCRLRKYAIAYGARPGRYKGERRPCEIIRDHPDVIFEPGKCISCGLCIQITEAASEELGLAFVGRGFDVRVAVPFNRSLKEGLSRTASECAEACPTGALVLKDGRRSINE